MLSMQTRLSGARMVACATLLGGSVTAFAQAQSPRQSGQASEVDDQVVMVSMGAAKSSSETDRTPQILVTGQKRQQTIFDTPSSVAILTAEDLQDRNITDFRSAFRLLGNVMDGDFVDAGFVIRGINSEGLTPGVRLWPHCLSMAPNRRFRVRGAGRAGRGIWTGSKSIVGRNPPWRAARALRARSTLPRAILHLMNGISRGVPPSESSTCVRSPPQLVDR